MTQKYVARSGKALIGLVGPYTKAISKVAEQFESFHDYPPTHVWVHKAYALRKSTEIEAATGLEVVSDDSITSILQFDVGITKDKSKEMASMAKDQEGMWELIMADSGGKEDVLKALQQGVETFTEVHGLPPEDAVLHHTYHLTAEWVLEHSGLNLITDRGGIVSAYPTYVYVGFREPGDKESSNIKSFSFSPIPGSEEDFGDEVGTLTVTFHRRNKDKEAVYEYNCVPTGLVEAFGEAESRGGFFSKHIKNEFQFNKLS